MTVTEALARATRHLREAGVPTPELDAERLLRHVLSWDRARVLASGFSALDLEQERHFHALIAERSTRRPLQHILGRQAFWKHDFLVSPDALIPRPETEILVEEALRALAGMERPVIVDVGTGTGCIGLSLAAERPDAVVHATDLSPAALAVARRNEAHLGLQGRVAFHEGHLLVPLPRDVRGRVDLVASNPPYVAAEERANLAPEVRDHEPALALFPPGDAYAIYRELLPAAEATIRPGGSLLLEVGLGMADEVVRIAEGAAFRIAAVREDLQGIPRAIVAVRS